MGKTFSTGLLTNGIWQDASNNIGIGGSPSGSYKLEVTGTAKVSSTLNVGNASANPTLVFKTGGSTNYNAIISTDSNADYLVINGGASASTSSGAQITIIGNDRYGTANGGQITIAAGTSANNSAYGYINFNTGATPTERMRILNSGYILIGATASTGVGASRLQITGATSQLLVSNTTSTGHIALYSTGVDAYITKNTASGNMYFGLAPQDGSSFTSQLSISNNGTATFLYDVQVGRVLRIAAYTGLGSGNADIYYNQSSGFVTFNQNINIQGLTGSGTRSVSVDSGGNLLASSDSSLKQEDKTHKIEGLTEILQLKPRAYKWLNDIKIRGEEAATEIGFFADEVNLIIPSAAPKNNNDLYGFYDRAVIAALVKAIQELSAQNQDLKSRLDKAGL